MNQDLLNYSSQVLYLIREQHWKSAALLCHQYYQRTSDPFFQFWRAFSYFKQDSTNEAINELTLIKNKKEFQFATSAALLYYSQQSRGVDKEIIEMCRNMQNEGRKTPNDRALASAIYFYLFVDEQNKAKEALGLLSQNQNQNLIVKGWYQLLVDLNKNMSQNDEPRDIQATFLYFEDIGNSFNPKPIEYLLGQIKACEQYKKFQVALDAVNELMIIWQDFPYTDCEKLKICMMINDWEKFQETTMKILEEDPISIFGLRAAAFYSLARKGDISESIEKIEVLFSAVTKQEDQNFGLIIDLCQLISRISGRNQQILAITIGQLEKCKKLQPLSGELSLELANENLMIEDYAKAYSLFQETVALDQSKIEALAGMIQCKIQQGVIDDAEKQLEFISEVQVSVGKTPEIAFLQALLQCKKTEGTESQSAYSMIEEALKLHLIQVKQYPSGFDFYIKFNPDYTFTISQMFLRNLSTNSMLSGKEQNAGGFGKGVKLLETILKQAPGMTNAQLLLATGKMSLGDSQEALKSITKVLELDPKNEDAYILHALISVKMNLLNQALNSLNQAISNNFSIRENPLFMLVKGEVEYRTEDFKNAQITLEYAYELIQGNRKSKIRQSSKFLQFSEKDKCQIQILLAKVFAKNKKDREAKQIMQKAIQQYAGTPQESVVMMANSEIAIEGGDVKKAINILKAVQKGQSNFQTSRILLADVYLKHVKDRRNYTKCYYELIEADPSFETYKLMGDALMRINEPQEAVTAYTKAQEIDPQNPEIIGIIGNALTLTYDYQKAIKYYENALDQDKNRIDLLVDLGRLYLRINDIPKAQQLLQYEKFVADEYAAPDLKTLRAYSQGFLLVARLITKNQQFLMNQAQKIEKEKQQQQMLAESQKLVEKIKISYESAINSQIQVIEKTKTESGDVNKEKEQLGQLHLEMARYYYNYEKNYNSSLNSLDEAIKFLQTNEQVIQLQADSLYQLNDFLGCEQKLKILQKINPKNDFANMMLSELMLKQNNSEQQIIEFVNLVNQQPNSFGTLSKVVEWYYLENRLDEALPIIENCTKQVQNSNEPGLCFCRGLYYKYKMMAKEALIQFNYAKRHHQYAENSITHMIDLYLNPEADLLYSASEEQPKQINSDNLRASELLLRELQSRGSNTRYTIMQSYVLMMSGFPKSVELAGQLLTQLLKQNQNSPSAMHALAINKFLLKKQTEAKNLLKLLWAKQPSITGWERDDLEKAWLLHADTFIAIQKYDQAEEVIRKCLKRNKTCAKAEELLGLIKEKEQSYIDAANSYEKAFKLTNQKNPVMGYRLAFNYLKAKRFTDAINICRIVLQINPAYPKLQSEILSKAIMALKP